MLSEDSQEQTTLLVVINPAIDGHREGAVSAYSADHLNELGIQHTAALADGVVVDAESRAIAAKTRAYSIERYQVVIRPAHSPPCGSHSSSASRSSSGSI